MPKRVNKIPPAGHKKRKEVVGVSANNESGPPKKRVRKRCSVKECTNYAKKGGVCIRHGAKVERKRCNVDECNNQVIKGGVCWRHGAKVKLCIVGNCTNQVVNGGLCIKHGAKVKLCSVGDCTNQRQNGGGVCWRHGAKVEAKRCSVKECTNYVQKGGVCKRHGAYSAAPPAQENFLCGDVQGGGNQNSVSTVVEVSDNEGEGGKNRSPIAGRKRKADNVDKQQSETAASNDIEEEDGPGEFVQEIPENKDAVVDGQNAESDKSSSGVANLKDDNEQDTSDMRPQKRARGEGNLKDDKVQDASDVAPVKEGEGGIGVAMEDGDSCGGDDQNEYDCGEDDNGDLNSEEGKQSHVVPEEITVTANDAEKESELLRLSAKLEEANNVINEKSEELEAIKSRSKSEHEQTELLRSQLNGVEAQIDEKNDIIAELEEELEAEKVKKAEMDTQLMTTATARLEERVAKDAANAKLWEMKKKFEAAKLSWKTWWREQKERLLSNLNNMETQLKTKSDAVVKLKAEVGKLQATKDEIQAQLQIATNNEVVLRSKVEELTKELKEVTTKFEAAESFWNSRREEKKIYAELNLTKSQLRAKSAALAESKKEGAELLELIESLRNQLEQSKGGSEVKEEELTDDEDITARLKERRTDKVAVNAQMKVMAANAKVDFAVREVEKRELELEEVSDKLEKQEFELEQAKAKIEELEKQQSGLNSRSRRGRKNAVDSLAQLPCSKTSNSNKKRVSTKSKKKNKHVVDSLQRC